MDDDQSDPKVSPLLFFSPPLHAAAALHACVRVSSGLLLLLLLLPWRAPHCCCRCSHYSLSLSLRTSASYYLARSLMHTLPAERKEKKTSCCKVTLNSRGHLLQLILLLFFYFLSSRSSNSVLASLLACLVRQSESKTLFILRRPRLASHSEDSLKEGRLRQEKNHFR